MPFEDPVSRPVGHPLSVRDPELAPIQTADELDPAPLALPLPDSGQIQAFEPAGPVAPGAPDPDHHEGGDGNDDE